MAEIGKDVPVPGCCIIVSGMITSKITFAVTVVHL